MIPRSDERPKTIAVRCNGRHGEGNAQAAISPGHLIVVDDESTDLPRTPPLVKVNPTAGAAVPVRIAKEQPLNGKMTTDNYAAGDVVPYVHCLPGDRVMCRVADEFVATPGAILKGHSDGTFVAHGGTGTALVEVYDNVDLSIDPLTNELLVQCVVL